MEELELHTGTPTLTHYMIFEQVLDLFEPPFPHLKNEGGVLIVPSSTEILSLKFEEEIF